MQRISGAEMSAHCALEDTNYDERNHANNENKTYRRTFSPSECIL